MKLSFGLAPLCCFAAAPAWAQADAPPGNLAQPTSTTDAATQDQHAQTETVASTSDTGSQSSSTDILSKNVVTVLLDGRLAFANGERSFVHRGLGKTQFQGTSDGKYNFYAVPQEADLIWTPRFTDSLSASVSAAYQRHQENAVDLLEAFVSFLPQQKGSVGYSLRAGIMWPEISLEHTTGGAWSTVDVLTPSAINAWVGEEVKVLGLEGTVRTSVGDSMLAFTGELRAGLSGNIGTVVFLDGGNVWADSWGFQLNDLRYAVGTGLRYQTPIGPIRVDVGYQLNPIEGLIVNGTPQQRRWRLHFSIGQAF